MVKKPMAKTSKKPSIVDKIKNKQAESANKKMLEELFHDWYIERAKVYKMNFVRGITFGLGSAIGGTIGFAIVLAILALLLNVLGGFPVIGDWFDSLNEEIPSSTTVE